MTNFFSFNYTFPIGMNNWFMPNWSFFNFSSMFQMPTINFNSWCTPFSFNDSFSQMFPQPSSLINNYSVFSQKPSSETRSSSASNTDTFTSSTKINYAKDNLKLDGYNALKGERLANIALNRSVGWTGYCAAYVKSDIQTAGLGSYKYGHAYQMPSILKNNKNFKEISPENVDVSKLPAGCILVYDKGTAGYSKKYGHTEITTGDGRAVSDGITKNLTKKPSNIFIPV